MKKKSKDSKLNIILSALLVLFICLLTFSIGVITGKGWTERDYKSKYIENDTHLKAAMEDAEPLGDEMTAKEVELLTQKALDEAKALQPESQTDNPGTQVEEKNAIDDREPASSKTRVTSKGQDKSSEDDEEEDDDDDSQEGDDKPAVGQAPLGRDASQAMKVAADKKKRDVASPIPQPTTPKPTSIEYTVQVAAYKTIEEAEVHSQKLIDKGFPAFPVQALINGKPWYRVSIGSFKSRKQAMKYEKALKKQAVVKNTFVQKIERLKK